MAYNVEKTDEQWRQELTPQEYAVLRQAGTERGAARRPHCEVAGEAIES